MSAQGASEGGVEPDVGGGDGVEDVGPEQHQGAGRRAEVAETLYLAGADPQPGAVGDGEVGEVDHVPEQPLFHRERQVEVRALCAAGSLGVPRAVRPAEAVHAAAQFGDRHHLDPDRAGRGRDVRDLRDRFVSVFHHAETSPYLGGTFRGFYV
ncbi:hypothetical protein AB0P17_28640 [Streptomyces sp. NPDC088124]|uniref:hypothetical protein n=1 Tax=Streptomyces sp. NPDC088124 TaxID=3154654 RepID=UPI003424ABE3